MGRYNPDPKKRSVFISMEVFSLFKTARTFSSCLKYLCHFSYTKFLKIVLNFNKFLLFNARSIQNKYQDISNLLQQLDSETIVIVTETWMSEEQSLNINLSAEHIFLHKNRSQTGAAKGGGVGIWIPKNIIFKRRRQFELADPKFFETLWLALGNPLTEKCLINISFCLHQSLGDFFKRIKCRGF